MLPSFWFNRPPLKIQIFVLLKFFKTLIYITISKVEIWKIWKI